MSEQLKNNVQESEKSSFEKSDPHENELENELENEAQRNVLLQKLRDFDNKEFDSKGASGKALFHSLKETANTLGMNPYTIASEIWPNEAEKLEKISNPEFLSSLRELSRAYPYPLFQTYLTHFAHNRFMSQDAWLLNEKRAMEEEFQRPLIEAILENNPSSFYLFEKNEDQNVQTLVKNAREFTRMTNDIMSGEKSIGERIADLETHLKEINPFVLQAMEQFSKAQGCSLQCVGIREDVRDPRFMEYVFINSFEGQNTVPIRIGLPCHRIRTVQTTQGLLSIFQKNFNDQLSKTDTREKGNASLKEQYVLWQKSDAFDLPGNNKMTVMAVDLASDGGFDNVYKMADTLEMFGKAYNAHISRPIMKLPHVFWKEGMKGMVIQTPIPEPSSKDRETEFPSLIRQNLQDAVDRGDSQFVLHYVIHGKDDPKDNLEIFQNSNAKFLAEAISSKDKDGLPLCSKIPILIIAESCFSGHQMRNIIATLKEANVSVKSLRIVAAADRTPAAFTMQSRSAINERFRKNTGNEKTAYYPALSYYLSYYYQLVEHLQSKGGKLQQGVGTFSHAIKFADRMVREDGIAYSIAGSVEEQDVQYYHYSTEQEADELLSKGNANESFSLQS